MSESKNFIKSAVGILIVVAICFVSVTIYKKGNASISNSIRDYDEIVLQFENAKLKNYENSTATGSQIVDLIKTLKEEDGVTIVVANGYTIAKKEEPKEYTYQDIYASDSELLKYIADKSQKAYYINPYASFTSGVMYDENREIYSVIFEQK